MADANTWMPFYIGDYLADTMHLNNHEHGAYVLLILHYWRCGPLPDDDKSLAAIARCDRREWISEVGPVVRKFFRQEDGVLHHKRIDAELTKAMRNSSKRREAANARWEQTRSKRDANASDVQCKRDDPRVRSPSPSPEVTTTVPSSVPRARHPANGGLPKTWDDARIEPAGDGPDEPNPDRPCVNGSYLDYTYEACLEAANLDEATCRSGWKPVVQWLADGYEPDQIIETIRAVAEKPRDAPIVSLAFFNEPIRKKSPAWKPLQSKH